MKKPLQIIILCLIMVSVQLGCSSSQSIQIVDPYCTETDSFHFTLRNLPGEGISVNYNWALNGPKADAPRGGQGWGYVAIDALDEENIVLSPDDMIADDYDARFYIMYIHVYIHQGGEQVAYYREQKSTYDWDYTTLPPVYTGD